MDALQPGIHPLTIHEFLERFCASETRQVFAVPMQDVFDFARRSGARHVFIGGSFVSEKERPNDIDILIAYDNEAQIPPKTEAINYAAINLDILFCSYADKPTMDAFLHMFSRNRLGAERGIAQVSIAANEGAYVLASRYDNELVKIVRAAYTGREIVERNHIKGILISIHGLYSHAEWNVDIAPIASSQGWIFAPYTYTGNNWELLVSRSKRKKTLEDFRAWIYDTCQRYEKYTTNLSIAAHSYGTYLVGAYLNGFDKLPIDLNAIILTGSLLNKGYNWDSHFDAARIGSVLNIHSPNDRLIKMIPDHAFKQIIGMDVLFGSAGHSGFDCTHSRMIQRQLDILNHTNTIKRDIVEQVWMPFLEINSNARQVNEMELERKAVK